MLLAIGVNDEYVEANLIPFYSSLRVLEVKVLQQAIAAM